MQRREDFLPLFSVVMRSSYSCSPTRVFQAPYTCISPASCERAAKVGHFSSRDYLDTLRLHVRGRLGLLLVKVATSRTNLLLAKSDLRRCYCSKTAQSLKRQTCAGMANGTARVVLTPLDLLPERFDYLRLLPTSKPIPMPPNGPPKTKRVLCAKPSKSL